MALCIKLTEYIGTVGFFMFLMIIAWILSCHWASKYNKLKDEMEESAARKYHKEHKSYKK